MFYDRAVNHGSGRAVHQAVDEGRVGVLINLLDAAGELVGRLSPVVILHRDHEHRLDLLRVRGGKRPLLRTGHTLPTCGKIWGTSSKPPR